MQNCFVFQNHRLAVEGALIDCEQIHVVLIAATARSEKMEHSTYDAITPCRETIEAPRDIKYTVMGISLQVHQAVCCSMSLLSGED